MKESQTTAHRSDDIFKSREEYFSALQKWIHEAQMWQNSMTCMPYLFLSHPELFPGMIPSMSPNHLSDPARRSVFGVQPAAANRVPTNPPGGKYCPIYYYIY